MQARIWATELARYIALYNRERERQQIDKCNDVLNRMKANNTIPTDQITTIEKQLEHHKRMVDGADKMLDGDMNNPDPELRTTGINGALEGMIEKREHIKNFIKHYC